MKSVLLILVPVFLLSYFLAGGIDSPFPKKVVIPSGEPRAVANVAPSGDGKQLQINDLRFKSPSPRPSPSLQPSNSPTPSTCPSGQKVAVNLLLDTSGSMGEPMSKLYALQEAAIIFTRFLKPDDVIGIQEFSSIQTNPNSPAALSCGYDRAACSIIPISKYNRLPIETALRSLRPHGATFMRDGFLLSDSLVTAALSNFPTSEYRWLFIFFSDGLPYNGVRKATADGYAPFPFTIDSQAPLNPPDVTEIVKSKMRLVTITLVDTGLAPARQTEQKQYMASIATPGSGNAYATATPTDLAEIFTSLGGSLCSN